MDIRKWFICTFSNGDTTDIHAEDLTDAANFARSDLHGKPEGTRIISMVEDDSY